ncbi:hypothetical protein [Streptomyces sp. NPDC001250]|uniref:hypothetical protein n=1 Tax=unclassified Streptomyces TaxID=2593676 RepID=UPI00332C3D61
MPYPHETYPLAGTAWDSGSWDYEEAAECVCMFVGLAQRARAAGAQLYCRFCA